MSLNIDTATISEIHKALQKKEISSTELLVETFDRIKKFDEKVKSFITTCEKTALEKAKEVDEKISHNFEILPLEGIPYCAKDVFCTKDVVSTAGSKILEEYIPVYDATVIKRVNDNGAILIGKNNCDPFGFGSSTENSGYFTTHNPYDLDRVPGGSSGGSAAAVRMGMGVFSIAEDTGGSIRQPASFCNVTGIKVTYGRVSRYGSMAYGSSLDTIGHMAKTVEDVALILEHTAGEDINDATTVPKHVPIYSKHLEESIKGKQIGIPKEYFETKGLSDEVKVVLNSALKVYENLGCHIEQVSLPHTKYAIADYYLIAISEVSANLSRYDGVRFGHRTDNFSDLDSIYKNSREEGFEDEVKRRIMLGTFALSSGYYDAYYKKAMQVRTILKQEMEDVFKKVDVILAPVAPTPPFKIGSHENDPLSMWLEDAFTVTLNPTGCPGLALPAGFSKADNLPVGMQLIGPQFSEETLFTLGHHFQKETDFHLKLPEILSSK